jgi:hypothetical protein
MVILSRSITIPLCAEESTVGPAYAEASAGEAVKMQGRKKTGSSVDEPVLF